VEWPVGRAESALDPAFAELTPLVDEQPNDATYDHGDADDQEQSKDHVRESGT
jgi:hypothetical protein